MTKRVSHFAQRLLARSAIAFVLLGSAAAIAQQQQGGGDNQGEHRGPPPKEALAACASSNSGDTCSFAGKRGQVSGTCQAPKQGAPLGCKPSGNRPGGDRRQSGQQD